MSERDEFEKWAAKEAPHLCLTKKGDTGEYVYKTADIAYRSWRAARASDCQSENPVAWVSRELVNGDCVGSMAYREKNGDDQVPVYARAQCGQGAEPIGFTWDAGRFGRQFTADAGVADRVRVDGVAVSPVYTHPQPAVPEGWKEAAMGAKRFADDMKMVMLQPLTAAAHIRGLADLILSTPTTPQADGWVRCDERLPTEADADAEGTVWYWSPEIGVRCVRWVTVRQYMSVKGISDHYWMPTGLKRPQPPKEGSGDE